MSSKMAAAVRRYEFKVEYGCSTNEEKWTKFYVEENEMCGFTMGDLDVRVVVFLVRKSDIKIVRKTGSTSVTTI